MNSRKIIVDGRVQGVGFRYMTKAVADRLHIVGTIKNRIDGSVEITAKGEPDALERFTKAVEASPTPAGRVTKMDVEEIDDLGPKTDFSIIG